MADERQYNAAGEVISGYLSPDEAREQGVAWAPRPNEPAPYRTEDESREEGTPYVPEAQHYANVGGNYDYYQNIDRFYNRPPATAAAVVSLGASAPATQTPTVGPTGLAYADDPVNYATGTFAPSNGYQGGIQSGIYPGGAAPVAAAGPAAGGMSNTMVYLMLAGAAVAVYFLIQK